MSASCNAKRPDGLPVGAKQCEICGEWMRCPSPRRTHIRGRVGYFCTDCEPDGNETPRPADTAAKHDAEYHGGRFMAGEW